MSLSSRSTVGTVLVTASVAQAWTLVHHTCSAALAPPAFLGAQIAVLKETAGKGTFCSLVMAVVVVKDILVFCCFAVNLELSTVVGVPLLDST